MYSVINWLDFFPQICSTSQCTFNLQICTCIKRVFSNLKGIVSIHGEGLIVLNIAFTISRLLVKKIQKTYAKILLWGPIIKTSLISLIYFEISKSLRRVGPHKLSHFDTPFRNDYSELLSFYLIAKNLALSLILLRLTT